jgi:ATP-dependent DNA helicase RecG
VAARLGTVRRKVAGKKTGAKDAGKEAPRASAKDRLAAMGLRRAIDCVLHLPLRYEDETRITSIESLRPQVAGQIEARVIRSEVSYRGRRQLTVDVEDDSGALTLRFLNFYGSQLKHFEAGRLLRIRGELRAGLFVREMVHPKYNVIKGGEPLPTALTPVYPSSDGVSQSLLRTAIGRAIESADLSDTLPPWIIAEYHFMSFEEAVRMLHFPPVDVDLDQFSERRHPAWTRIKFDELLAQQLSLQRARLARRDKRAPRLPERNTLVPAFLASLPFRLTGAQQRVWAEISGDLSAPYPMQRLLQGDVGSGKTVVAALAALRAIENGRQAALMAPTEILAEQHFAKISEWLESLGVETVWLTGSIKKAAREKSVAAIETGRAQLVIGTHALIQVSVTFKNLGLAIVDEQQRFGVDQRLALRAKSQELQEPHLLMMSATPIPRTLAMTYFADLEVSTIDELPPGRQPVTTKLIASTRRDQVISGAREVVQGGAQVYWVCPLIEESEALQLKTAVETFEALSIALAGIRVGLVHGRLGAADKASVMQDFVKGEIKVLVATTVIEVGVDVPNASLMVIEHAERFGLSQLHQLRGRIGRGNAASTCILLYQTPLSALAKERLRIVRESADGFELARRDLELRGPGEFLGQRQSGEALLRFADLREDSQLAEQARAAALILLRDTSIVVERHLARWLGGRAEYLKV